jgi:uncharacterized membrane protein
VRKSEPASSSSALGLAPSLGKNPPARLAIVDIARGLAIAQMVVYHFCYDLNHFGWVHWAMTRQPGWVVWRTAIVTQFLFLVGIALVLREQPGAVAPRHPFTRRWWQIAFCAALVSAASAMIFGARWIWFGVLHFVVVAQLLVIPVRGLGIPNLALGAIALLVGVTVEVPGFASNALSWIGFSPVKPLTEDFVPVLPWLGVVLLGIGAGNLWRNSTGNFAQSLRVVDGGRLAFAAWIGRWPLTIYMVHQPLLFGAFTLIQMTRGNIV